MPEQTLRETLEAAYEEVGDPTPSAAPEEAGRSTQDAPEPVRDTAPTEESTSDGKPEAEPSGGRKRGSDGKFLKKENETQAETASPDQSVAAPEAKPEEPPPESQPSIRAPESWKPGAREHWAKLPPDVQREVSRREKEITQTLQQTATQRKLAEHFTESIRPFEAMIRAENRDPVVAASELFATAALLRMGSPAQKANLVANMVKNFNIPIDILDAALVGDEIPDEDSKIARLLDQRLQPVTQFMTELQSMRQKREQSTVQTVQTEIESFASDPKNEFFDDVRGTMADLMEVATKNGRDITLQQAYERAIALTPEIKEVVDKRKAEEIARKKAAGSSLPASPPPQGGPKGGNGTLRDDIESAFASVANR